MGFFVDEMNRTNQSGQCIFCDGKDHVVHSINNNRHQPAQNMPESPMAISSTFVPRMRYGVPRPTVVAPQPTVIAPQPTVVAPQPTVVAPQPTLVAPQPTVVAPQPTMLAPQPTMVVPQPMTMPPHGFVNPMTLPQVMMDVNRLPPSPPMPELPQRDRRDVGAREARSLLPIPEGNTHLRYRAGEQRGQLHAGDYQAPAMHSRPPYKQETMPRGYEAGNPFTMHAEQQSQHLADIGAGASTGETSPEASWPESSQVYCLKQMRNELPALQCLRDIQAASTKPATAGRQRGGAAGGAAAARCEELS